MMRSWGLDFQANLTYTARILAETETLYPDQFPLGARGGEAAATTDDDAGAVARYLARVRPLVRPGSAITWPVGSGDASGVFAATYPVGFAW